MAKVANLFPICLGFISADARMLNLRTSCISPPFSMGRVGTMRSLKFPRGTTQLISAVAARCCCASASSTALAW